MKFTKFVQWGWLLWYNNYKKSYVSISDKRWLDDLKIIKFDVKVEFTNKDYSRQCFNWKNPNTILLDDKDLS